MQLTRTLGAKARDIMRVSPWQAAFVTPYGIEEAELPIPDCEPRLMIVPSSLAERYGSAARPTLNWPYTATQKRLVDTGEKAAQEGAATLPFADISSCQSSSVTESRSAKSMYLVKPAF